MPKESRAHILVCRKIGAKGDRVCFALSEGRGGTVTPVDIGSALEYKYCRGLTLQSQASEQKKCDIERPAAHHSALNQANDHCMVSSCQKGYAPALWHEMRRCLLQARRDSYISRLLRLTTLGSIRLRELKSAPSIVWGDGARLRIC